MQPSTNHQGVVREAQEHLNECGHKRLAGPNQQKAKRVRALLGVELDCVQSVVRPVVMPVTQRHAHVCITTLNTQGGKTRCIHQFTYNGLRKNKVVFSMCQFECSGALWCTTQHFNPCQSLERLMSEPRR